MSHITLVCMYGKAVDINISKYLSTLELKENTDGGISTVDNVGAY